VKCRANRSAGEVRVWRCLLNSGTRDCSVEACPRCKLRLIGVAPLARGAATRKTRARRVGSGCLSCGIRTLCFLAELLDSLKQPRFDQCFGQFEHFGDLRPREVFDISQAQHFALLFREALKGVG